MNPTPAWINRAAEELLSRINGVPGTADDFGTCERDAPRKVATIISKHAPQPKAFEWEHWIGDVWYAKTPFGNYRASSKDWNFNGYGMAADSLDAAKAAAFSDYCDKLKACYGEGGA